MKYLYPYECDKKNLSTPNELQAAIDGNRREGRRSSYGQFDSQMQGQISQIQQQMQRSPISGGLQQMSPLSLVTHAAASQNAHRLANGQLGQLSTIVPQNEFEHRMIEYIKLMHNNAKETSSKWMDWTLRFQIEYELIFFCSFVMSFQGLTVPIFILGQMQLHWMQWMKFPAWPCSQCTATITALQSHLVHQIMTHNGKFAHPTSIASELIDLFVLVFFIFPTERH